ncbi:heat shock protein transcriptional repressor HspR [Brooklawnia propionicigenes]|nr:MerR family transcriptional regulator [Brooklawnia sp. SH051]
MSAGMLPEVMDPDGPIFSISVAASLAEMHPQTLRQYDRLGLVIASRTKGGGRRYSPRDIQRLRLIQRLSQEGINLTGIRRILALQSELEEAQRRMDDMTELVRRLVEQHESQGRRIFSAGSTGNVAQGRFYHPRLALPGR